MSHNPPVHSLQPNALFVQQENEAILRTIEWSGELDTDTISTSTWTAENSGSTIANEGNDTITTEARLSGTPGCYLFTNKITTAAGDTREQQIQLTVLKNDRSRVSDYRDYGYV